MYMFSVAGMQLFGKSRPRDPTTALYYPFDCGMGYETFACAFATNFQVQLC